MHGTWEVLKHSGCDTSSICDLRSPQKGKEECVAVAMGCWNVNQHVGATGCCWECEAIYRWAPRYAPNNVQQMCPGKAGGGSRVLELKHRLSSRCVLLSLLKYLPHAVPLLICQLQLIADQSGTLTSQPGCLHKQLLGWCSQQCYGAECALHGSHLHSTPPHPLLCSLQKGTSAWTYSQRGTSFSSPIPSPTARFDGECAPGHDFRCNKSQPGLCLSAAYCSCPWIIKPCFSPLLRL